MRALILAAPLLAAATLAHADEHALPKVGGKDIVDIMTREELDEFTRDQWKGLMVCKELNGIYKVDLQVAKEQLDARAKVISAQARQLDLLRQKVAGLEERLYGERQ